MGATNHTTYYELSQFIGTDKPAWLQDYNGDMTKIDEGIKEAKNAADDANTAASNAQGDATDALNAIETINTTLGTIEDTLGTATGNISTINALIGNGTPTTSDQTIIGAINGIEGAIAPREDGENLANSYAIGEQFARGGSVYTALTPLPANTPFASLTLNTDYKVSDTLVDQIADIREDISSLPNGRVLATTGEVTVTADGVKTYAQLYTALADALHAVAVALHDGEYIEAYAAVLRPQTAFILNAMAHFTNTSSANYTMVFQKITLDDTNVIIYVNNETVAGGNDTSKSMQMRIMNDTDPVAVFNKSSEVPASSTVLRIYYRKWVPIK